MFFFHHPIPLRGIMGWLHEIHSMVNESLTLAGVWYSDMLRWILRRACSAAVRLALPTLRPTGHSFIEQFDRDGDKDCDNRREQHPL